MVCRFNEERIETLFGYNSTDKTGGDGKKDLASKDVPQFVRILDPKKGQNLAISLRALSVSPVEVCSAVKEGNIDFAITALFTCIGLPFCYLLSVHNLVIAYLFTKFTYIGLPFRFTTSLVIMDIIYITI